MLMWIFFLLIRSTISELELKLVHVIFTHKFYTPIEFNETNQVILPKKLDFKYFLENSDAMVNPAKMDLYKFGVFLRAKYDHFLGDIYYPDIMQMRTSEYFLSMISGLLVDAGLWPPADVQKWKEDLNWQPIPTDYVPAEHDYLLLGTLCPRFLKDTQKIYEENTAKAYEPLFDYVTKNLGFKISKPSEIEMLHAYFETLVDNNITLPEWVDSKIFPNGEMRDVILFSYDLLSQTLIQKQLNGGTFLKRIIDNSFEHQKSSGSSKLKISMFSAEQRNIIGILQSMKKWSPHILKPVTALLFEVYGNSTNHYFIKMYYSSDDDLESFKLNDCEELCPLTGFAKLLQPVLPVDEKSLCTSISSKGSTYFSNNKQYYLILIIFNMLVSLFYETYV